jgi:hypothetical protein
MIAGSFLLFISILNKFDLREKVKKMFKKVKFPG